MMKSKNNVVLLGLGTALVLAVPAWAQVAKMLRYKGAVVSQDVRMIDGRPYVPLADVARMLSGNTVQTGGGYELQTGGVLTAPAGGASEVRGLHGKVGQIVFTGKWRFEVTQVAHLDQYETQFQPAPEIIKPIGDNDELVVVTGFVKNAQEKPKELALSVRSLNDTALADDQGQAYPPFQFDFTGGGFYGPPSMLPGAAQHFAAIFSIRKGTSLKDLVFSLSSYDDTKFENVRISLAP